MRNNILILFVAILFYNCNNKTTNKAAELLINPFQGKQLTLQTPAEIPIDVLYTEGIIVSDKYIITYGNKGDKLINVYSRSNHNKLGSFLAKGSSRDEVLFLSRIIQKDESNGRLKLLIQSYLKYMNWLDVDSSLIANKAVFTQRNEFRTPTQKDILANSGGSHDLGNNTLLMRYQGFDDNIKKPSFIFLDLKKDSVVGHIPWIGLFDENKDSYPIVGGNYSLSNDRTKLASAFFTLDMIGFYDLESMKWKNTFFSEHTMDLAKAAQENKTYYRTCSGGEKYFYAVKLNDKNISIQVFEWDGKPVFEYFVNETIRFIDVDEKQNKIFAVVSNELDEMKIVMYDLPVDK